MDMRTMCCMIRMRLGRLMVLARIWRVSDARLFQDHGQ
jgi:hypothetical protein